MLTRRTMPVVDDSGQDWGATCGPYTLAAMAGMPLAGVRGVVSDREPDLFGERLTFRGWMNVGQMKRAAESVGLRLVPTSGDHQVGRLVEIMRGGGAWIVLLAWRGPWPPRVDQRFSHWIGVARGRVYEPNRNEWMGFVDWVSFEPRLRPDRAERNGLYLKWHAATRPPS